MIGSSLSPASHGGAFPNCFNRCGSIFIMLALWRCSEILEQVAFANLSLAAVSTIAAARLASVTTWFP
jgi:hypothetical protein